MSAPLKVDRDGYMCYAMKRVNSPTSDRGVMGDSYREELKRNHKKSGFRPNPRSFELPGERALEAERRALRVAYFKKASRRTHASLQASQKRLIDA